ncbi:MAG: alpha-1,4-glucan--maltose-1-phosphate maltosyltransferase [Candidatus Dormibacteria bacterium]
MPGRLPRVVIEDVRPQVDGGRFPAKAAVGLPLEVSATFLIDGHDKLLGWVRHGCRDARSSRPTAIESPLTLRVDDRWVAMLSLDRPGTWWFEVVALADDYGSWLRDLELRWEAGQDIRLELEEAALMAERRAARRGVGARDRAALADLAAALRADADIDAAVAAASLPASSALMERTIDRSGATTSGRLPLWVDRAAAAFSAWYELFPRSTGATDERSGTLRTVEDRLPAIAAMGFDIVYLPPIHPIGTTHRKGRNNALVAAPDDPGSPWAIGGAAGGHEAVHPDLGTAADLEHLVGAARALGMEIALDYALQCSPDHPWVGQHPQWFRHRPDGSIRFAENPPKRYQDIYPFNFETDDRDALWEALREVLLVWVRRGVRAFRVDNPHTKPVAFWEWLITTVHEDHPDVLFLAEAFTKPALMRRLAKVGFSQSYTYFTWRNARWELEQYLAELSGTAMVDYFRPNFWVNTPDILHQTLQRGGPAAFRLRLVLAALAAPSWGMYSGYELCENTPLREGSEEYLDSEKYQVRVRDWDTPRSLAPLIGAVNGIRRRHREAVAALPLLRLHEVDNPNLLCFSRMSWDLSDILLVVVNLDPHNVQEGMTWLNLPAIAYREDTAFSAHDELTGSTYDWQGPRNYVRLDPQVQPAHVLHLSVRQ